MNSTITPVAVFPGTAGLLYVSPGASLIIGQPPGWFYELWDGPDNPAATPPFTHTVLKNGNEAMTADQWTAWAAGGSAASDAAYVVGCVATNLGLALTGSVTP
jgi:hypothetical protein